MNFDQIEGEEKNVFCFLLIFFAIVEVNLLKLSRLTLPVTEW